MAYDGLDRYVASLVYTPKTPEEELDLSYRIAQDDIDAFKTLVGSGLRLVIKFAHDFRGQLELDDLVAEGNKGVMHAAEKFDPRKGSKFSSYAKWWIKQTMRLAICRQSRTIRVADKAFCAVSKAQSVYDAMEQSLGREPTVEELAERLSKKEIELVYSGRVTGPLDDNCAVDVAKIPDERNPKYDISSWPYCRAVMDRVLKPRDRDILVLRYGLDGERAHTLKEVGAILGGSVETIRKAEIKAIQTLRPIMLKYRKE